MLEATGRWHRDVQYMRECGNFLGSRSDGPADSRREQGKRNEAGQKTRLSHCTVIGKLLSLPILSMAAIATAAALDYGYEYFDGHRWVALDALTARTVETSISMHEPTRAVRINATVTLQLDIGAMKLSNGFPLRRYEYSY
jgi:hypothetical protein